MQNYVQQLGAEILCLSAVWGWAGSLQWIPGAFVYLIIFLLKQLSAVDGNEVNEGIKTVKLLPENQNYELKYAKAL